MKVALFWLLSTVTAQMFEMSAIASSDLADILNMANKLMEGMEANTLRAVAPKNPCEQDMARLNCASAKCLAAKVTQLSPGCARLVIAPSPSPDPMMERILDAGDLVEIFEIGMPEAIEVSFTDVDGGELFNPALEFFRTLTPELAGMFVPSSAKAPPTISSPQAVPSSHPCAAEVSQCVRETGSKVRSVIERCLVAHYDELSTTCKCFVHETNDSPEALAALKQRMPPAAAAPTVMTVTPAMTRPHWSEEHFTVHQIAPGTEPMRHISCMLFMPLMVVAIALLVRRCCLFCCHQKPIFAAVVPPEQATINTVQPLICVPIAPPLKPEEMVKEAAKA